MPKHGHLTAAITQADQCYQLLRRPHLDHPALLLQTKAAIQGVEVALREDPNPQSPTVLRVAWQWEKMKPKIVEITGAPPPPIAQQKRLIAHRKMASSLTMTTVQEAHSREEIQRLEADVEALRDMQRAESVRLREDGKHLEVATTHVERSDKDLSKGLRELIKASRYKLLGATMTGAVAGALVGGPVGLLVGAKGALGMAACLGAGAVTGAATTRAAAGALYGRNKKCVEITSKSSVQ